MAEEHTRGVVDGGVGDLIVNFRLKNIGFGGGEHSLSLQHEEKGLRAELVLPFLRVQKPPNDSFKYTSLH